MTSERISWTRHGRAFALFLVVMPLTLIAFAQEQQRSDCANAEEQKKIFNELTALKKETGEKNPEYARQLKEDALKTKSASDAYARCTQESGVLDHLVGNDCSREKEIMNLMSSQATRTSDEWKAFNAYVQGRLMMIRNKPPCG